jgi:hypothetical protein
MKKPVSRLAPVVLAVFGAYTLAATPAKPLQIGPFKAGMSFEAARAAAPSLAWRDFTVSRYTGKVLSIAAPDAITLGGLPHAVELRPGYYNSYSILVKHVESVADAAACDELGAAVLADLEERFGTFAPPTAKTERPPQIVNVGKHSTMAFLTPEESAGQPAAQNATWRQGNAQHDEGDNSIRFESAYSSDEFSSPVCTLITLLDHHPAAPPWETLPFDPSLFVRQPSIAVKHMSLEGVTLPKPTVAVDFACLIDRHSGMLSCSSKADVKGNEGVIAAALRRTLAMQVDATRLDPDDPLPVRMDLTVTLDEKDRRPIDFLNAPRVHLSDLEWAQQPTAEEAQAAYPKSLLERGMGAKVSVTCQVQSDLSVVCAVTDPRPQGDEKAAEDYRKLTFASVAVMSLYRAAPNLRSGEASAGAVIDTRVAFTPID